MFVIEIELDLCSMKLFLGRSFKVEGAEYERRERSIGSQERRT